MFLPEITSDCFLGVGPPGDTANMGKSNLFSTANDGGNLLAGQSPPTFEFDKCLLQALGDSASLRITVAAHTPEQGKLCDPEVRSLS